MTTAAAETARQAQRNGRAKGLAGKLVEASLEVENVEKRGKNTAQNYSYVQAEDVAAAATKALLARGVLSVFECLSSEAHPIRSKGGSDGLIVTVTCQLVVTDSETGQTASKLAMGSGSDYPGDKAIYKAMTGARKYAFIHLLGIPIGDDPDAPGQEPRGARQASSPQNAASGQVAKAEAIKFANKTANIDFDRLCTMFGAVGADAPKIKRRDSLVKAIEALTKDQLDELTKAVDG